MGKNLKVAIALSGGIDSATSARLLLEEGYDVTGLHMKILPVDEIAYGVVEITERLGIDLKVVDLSKDFKKHIIDPFCNAYLRGITPNPCVECNKYIKFGRLLTEAKKLGAEKLATGHYCNLIQDRETGKVLLLKGTDKTKDQSYFLWRLTQGQLKHALFPLGNYKKEDIKESAFRIFPFLKGRAESQEICFIDDDYKSFLKTYFGDSIFKKGKVLDTGGRLLGYHKGIESYTIGQRKGLGISSDRPLYVSKIIPDKNIIVLATDEEIYEKEIIVSDLNFLQDSRHLAPFRADVKIRYNSKGAAARIKMLDDSKAVVTFDKRQRSVTPGQSAVFYDGEILLGGGIIVK